MESRWLADRRRRDRRHNEFILVCETYPASLPAERVFIAYAELLEPDAMSRTLGSKRWSSFDPEFFDFVHALIGEPHTGRSSPAVSEPRAASKPRGTGPGPLHTMSKTGQRGLFALARGQPRLTEVAHILSPFLLVDAPLRQEHLFVQLEVHIPHPPGCRPTRSRGSQRSDCSRSGSRRYRGGPGWSRRALSTRHRIAPRTG